MGGRRFYFMSIAAVVTCVACTKPNPAVCCTSMEDCAAIGANEERPCKTGLACIDHSCEPLPCAEGCSPESPVCSIESGACEPCSESSQCTSFPSTPRCEVVSGRCVDCLEDSDCTARAETPRCNATTTTCVECIDTADCASVTPVCETSACRGCSNDSECASLVCESDGSCAAEEMVLYLAPDGADGGDCTKAAPCKSLTNGALPRSSQTRNRIVLGPGTYNEGHIVISSATTTAQSMSLRGSGATLVGESYEYAQIEAAVPMFIRGITLDYVGQALWVKSESMLEGVSIRARGIQVDGPVTFRDLRLEVIGPTYGILVVATGALVLDRGEIFGGTNAIQATANGAAIQIANLLVHRTSAVAINAPNARGEISNTTVADTGTSVANGPRGISCGSQLVIRSSIVWTPGGTPLAGECSLLTTIAGPTAVPGASSTDPRFVNPGASDYHLQGNSPAKDVSANGPPHDFEGDLRPRGISYDAGADEAP